MNSRSTLTRMLTASNAWSGVDGKSISTVRLAREEEIAHATEAASKWRNALGTASVPFAARASVTPKRISYRICPA
jgi:hypothetical protein